MRYHLLLFVLLTTGMQACSELEPRKPAADQVLDGPLEGISDAQRLIHARGDAAFTGQVFTSTSGLGPVFVASSCASCHAGDGKGHPFTTLIRFGQSDSTGNQYLHQGGPQLQNRALPGFAPEVLPAGAPFSKFLPPINTGLGYLELVSDADILAMSDPNDQDHDGISGVPNYQTLPTAITPHEDAIERGGKYICRFGKKAGAYNLLHQTVNAYNQDIGITSAYDPIDTYTGKPTDPEISTETINDVVFYLQTLKAPIQRNQQDATINLGSQIFISIGCESCHRQKLTTSYSPIDALSLQEFKPYTDLLLHDMGPALDDGYTEGTAKTYEWRTPPLWGLGLAPLSQGGKYFLMHDGRAGTIESAILLHGGEGTTSVSNFNSLSQTDKNALILFLKSL